MRLFLDDVREPKDCLGYMYQRIGPDNFLYMEEWTVVRNFDDFMTTVNQAMQDGVKITHISFDHDLSDLHYEGNLESNGNINYNKFKEKTGYHCAKWLKEWYREYKLELPIMFVHSMNPVGVQNIINLFKDG